MRDKYYSQHIMVNVEILLQEFETQIHNSKLV